MCCWRGEVKIWIRFFFWGEFHLHAGYKVSFEMFFEVLNAIHSVLRSDLIYWQLTTALLRPSMQIPDIPLPLSLPYLWYMSYTENTVYNIFNICPHCMYIFNMCQRQIFGVFKRSFFNFFIVTYKLSLVGHNELKHGKKL